MNDVPNLDMPLINSDLQDQLSNGSELDHAPKMLLLYGFLRARSYSRLVVEESALILREPGCATRIFDPSGLPLPDDEDESHPKV